MMATEIAQTNGHITALTVTNNSPSEKLQQLREQLKTVYLDRSEAAKPNSRKPFLMQSQEPPSFIT